MPGMMCSTPPAPVGTVMAAAARSDGLAGQAQYGAAAQPWALPIMPLATAGRPGSAARHACVIVW